MLALPARRQHLAHHHHTPTTPSPPNPHNTPYHQLPQTFAAQHLFDQKLLNDYLESQQQSFGSDSFMTSAYTDFASPAIRVQQSTPTPQPSQSNYSHISMLPTTINSGLESWHSYGNVQGQSLQTPSRNQNRGHQRASSSSSTGSSASQFQAVGPTAGYQYVAYPNCSPSQSTAKATSCSIADKPSRAFQNHLPTPTHTPTQDTFMNNNYNNFTPVSGSMDQTMAAHMSMKQALMDQGDDVPDFAHSAQQSESSYGHVSPATPHTAQDDMEFKMPTNGETDHEIESSIFDELCTDDDAPDMRPVPKFERTYTDIAADNFYDPSTVAAPAVSQSKPAQSSLLSPYRSNATENIQRALQAAQYARSHSPSSTASRGDSPFRRGSPYRQPSSTFNSPMVGSAAATREQNRQADAAYAMKSQIQNTEDAEPKTISPKDALLDYRETEEDSKAPLFPDNGAAEYDNQYNGDEQYRNASQPSFDASTAQSYPRDNWATPQFPQSFPTATPSLPQSSSFNFVTPSVQTNLHSMPISGNSQYRSTPSSMPSAVEQTPEFPAHLTSMESSASEAEPPNGSQNSILSERFLQKPTSSGADSGTYSCTYHGCSQRFETPQKLQKHKREGHRNAQTATLSESMTSAAILERNSQAGPHKCERTNPTTGKPCNTVFSRPYDLTRHEDTIHNGRKQKVRCALCVEEKTFSRNDALTRHMVSDANMF